MTRVLTLTLALLASSCQSPFEAPPAAPPDLPEASVTRWTEQTELFMEHPALVTGETARFAIHLTRLSDFAPVTAGRVTVRLLGATKAEFAVDAPSRPGIFGVDVTPPAPGRYTLEVTLEGPQVSDLHDAGTVQVHADAARVWATAPEGDEGEGITFLKEQQWTLEFGTAPAGERALRDSVSAAAEIQPRSDADAVVAAPISGRLVAASGRPLGSAVKAGEVLGEIVPNTAGAGDRPTLALDVSDADARLRLASVERARVERLLAEGAVPARRLEEAQVAEARANAAMAAASARLDQLDVLRTGEGAFPSEMRYAVRAPIGGVIAAASATPGSTVEQGERLFRIVSVDTVHVVAHVPETSAHRLTQISSAEIEVPGADPIALGALLSRGRVVDEASRTVPVVFEWRPPDAGFAVGQTVQVRLLTAAGPRTVVVPESSLVDDGGRPVVFVQIDGETFERRAVQVGRREGGLVEVRDGVLAGERVVTRGAPLVRLASLSAQVPAHGHVH